MKKSVFISGIVCANLMLFGSMFKVFHWPGANVMLVLSILLFCFHFLPFALINNYQNQQEKKHMLLHVVTFVVFFISMMGVLFKIMHWPGASVFLFLGIPLPFVLFLPVYLYQTRKEKNNSSVNFLGIMFGLTFLAVFSVLLALNVSKDVLNRFVLNLNNYNDLTTSVNIQSKQNNLKEKSNNLDNYIEDLKCELLTLTNNNVCNQNGKVVTLDPGTLINLDNTSIPKGVLLGDNESKLAELKKQINGFTTSVLASPEIKQQLKELTKSLFDLSDQNSVSWEQREFAGFQLVVVLDVLSQIQSNARLIETEANAITMR